MHLTQDREYDLDLGSFLGITPTPAAPRKLHDGWSEQVPEPGGLRHDEIRVLGERSSTKCHPSAGRGGTVYDQHGIPIDDNDNVASEDVRTHDEWLAGRGPPSTASAP